MTVEWFKYRFKTDQGAEHDGSMTPKNKIEAASWTKDPAELHVYLDQNQPTWIKEATLRNKHLNASHIDRALGDDNPDVRWAAIKNPNVTKEHIDRALGDDKALVRRAAIKNPNVTKEHIDRALCDDESSVRFVATENPIYQKHYPNGHTIVNGNVVAK